MVSRISGSLEEVFKKIDTDKSGQIDANELKALFEMLHCDIDDVSTCVPSLNPIIFRYPFNFYAL